MSINRRIFTFFVFIILIIDLEVARGRPAEAPTKFNLDTSVEKLQPSDQSSPTTWQQGMELLGQIGDALRFGRGKLINSAMMARNIIADRAEGLASEARNNVASVLAVKSDILAQGSTAVNSLVNSATLETFSPKKEVQETVTLENENSQALFEVKKNNPIGNLLESYLQPKALVDRIREEEKYGNSGDKFIGIGRALVNGFEGLSNFLNIVVDLPINKAKKASRGVTEALNQLGGRLIGLQ